MDVTAAFRVSWIGVADAQGPSETVDRQRGCGRVWVGPWARHAQCCTLVVLRLLWK